ncbi:uncharacterized protein LOC112323299 isoform X1 [Populus trichocarpa]|uniref:uncharacterized protein LOC112323299 isoform X1 n=1 Tax=Populus trichocarpa TaxID=3694 RepID=UPI000D188209|nr:uncharacterized protein LOC112323299 isoform X1 [Populus trichocarpa]XP_024465085.1 uncharacterized protein LOC112323299 isoform X1 [Populus trichocarpa]XP_024465086.1 uncharacterized protein LOC112323299 isoform X1 [Populus trichocarpa]XP_024465087.1 uncharacterized protein LOC112323299 isoform X1 [Populus trichocarpa]|eukprot:XP_024465084.1 uncharacterized protein LOC112323299 isoform X1 [Populus trichocarpa]
MFDSSSRLKMMIGMLQVAKMIQILKLLKLSLMKSMYKACHKGTVASKKKKKATLHRVICSTKRQQRLSLENSNSNCNSLFNHLKNAQGFAEKLFCRLQTSNECFEVPPDAVEPLFKQIVNQFVHDRSRPEAISVGQEKRRKQNRSGEQFRGKKAWK